jgi:dihydrolipoamide dehydrogenase
VTPLPGVEVKGRIVSSDDAIALPEVPERLAVIGGGYIGLELGSVWRRLGSKVVVVEFLKRLAPGLDAEMAEALRKVLEKQDFEFRLGHKVVEAKQEGKRVVLTVQPVDGGDPLEMKTNYALVAIGRRPFTRGVGLDAVGVQTDDHGRIVVDSGFRTNVEGIYAIGDVIAGPMLAHKAEEEGIALAELLAGQAGHVNYGAIPAVVYTWPELAMVGKTEEELKNAGVEYKVGRFPFSANAMAKSRLDTKGLVKIIADRRTDTVLGVHILGPEAGALIHEAVLGMEFSAAAEDLARTSHAHPTLPEALREAALTVDGRTINL